MHKQQLPTTLIRIDDGEEFTINVDGTYSLEVSKQSKDSAGDPHFFHRWTLARLINTGEFMIKENCNEKIEAV